MGADITFYKGKKSFYFRDTYNNTNLAWVIGLSYWCCKNNKKFKIEFFEQLAKITDEQIKERVDDLHGNKTKEYHIVPDKKSWTKMFSNKRAEIHKNLKLIRSADRISWNV